MKTLEEHIIKHTKSGEVWGDIRSAFAGQQGQAVLEMLAGFRHPHSSPMLDRNECDPCMTAYICGQKDIISTLIRYAMEPGGEPQFNPHSVKSSA